MTKFAVAIKKTMAKKTEKPAVQQEQVNLEEAINKSEQFFEQNKKIIFSVLGVIILAVAGGMLYSSKVVAPREIRAAEAIYPGESYMTDGDFRTALEGDAYGYEGFEALSKEYKNTKAGKLAAAYAGLCCAQLDSFEVAVKYLEKFKGNDQMAAPAITGALASCYANLGQNEKAASTYEKAAKQASNNLMSPYFNFQAAVIYEAIGKKDQALKLHQTNKVSYPESTEGQEADKYIARINSSK